MNTTTGITATILILILSFQSTFAQECQSPTDIHSVNKLLQETRTGYKLPALGIGYVQDGKSKLIQVVGIRKEGKKTKAENDDLWHLGSNSKPITALLLALLIDLGLIDWDTTLVDVFPKLARDWPEDTKTISVQHLLTHTSGLPQNWPGGWFQLKGKESPAFYRQKMMQQISKAKLTHKPGAKYVYSNLGYTVLGAVIDKVTKSTWETEVQKRVFRPLNIDSAGFGPTQLKDKGLQPWPHYPSGKAVPENGVLDNPPVMNPAGRVHMSIADINRFMVQTLRLARGEKGLLKPKTARKLFTHPFKTSPHSLSGWLSLRPKTEKWRLLHDGSNVMNFCSIELLPNRNLAVVVCTNKGFDESRKACQKVRSKILMTD